MSSSQHDSKFSINDTNNNTLPLLMSSNCQDYGILDGSKLLLICIYVVLISVGLFGNAMVISMIAKVVVNKGFATNVYVHVICLSLLDFAYLASGPFLVAYMITGNWIFGNTICRINYVFEGLNKTMSIYLLVVLSGDRYLAVCRPTTSSKYRTVNVAFILLAVLGVLVAVTSVPIYMYTYVVPATHSSNCYQCGIWFPMIENPKVVTNTSTPDNSSNTNDITSNYFTPWNNMGSYYALFLIITYYLLPAVLILVFYTKIVFRLRSQSTTLMRKNNSKRNKVTKSVLAVVMFYFVCWTPYWLLQSLITFFPSLQYSSPEVFNRFIYAATVIYLLPYVNSCIDPILYAFMNKHLMIAYARSAARRTSRFSSRLSASATMLSRQNSDSTKWRTNNVTDVENSCKLSRQMNTPADDRDGVGGTELEMALDEKSKGNRLQCDKDEEDEADNFTNKHVENDEEVKDEEEVYVETSRFRASKTFSTMDTFVSDSTTSPTEQE